MKKIFCVLLTICLVTICFCGCDNSSEKLTNNNIEETEEINEVCEHSFADATCTEASKCTICGEISGTALGHSYSNATCTEPQKCTRCGQRSGSALGHTTNSGTCSRCGKYFGKSAADILKDIERYPKYLSIDYEIINTQIEIYEISGKTSTLKEIIDKVTEMYKNVEKIRNACAGNPELKILVDDCNRIEYPVYTGNDRSYLSDVKAFNRQCSHMCAQYNALV